MTESVQASRDPDDDKYLAFAVAGQAACVVSGDQDLLVLKMFRGILIQSPVEFLAIRHVD